MRFLTSRFRQIAFLMTCQQHKRRILFIWSRPSVRSVVLIKSAPAVVSSQSVVSSHQSAQFLRAAAHVGRSSDCSVQWLKKKNKIYYFVKSSCGKICSKNMIVNQLAVWNKKEKKSLKSKWFYRHLGLLGAIYSCFWHF